MREIKATVVLADSSVRLNGIDMGTDGLLVAWNRKDGYLTVKWDGGKHWSGRGQQSYSPTRFITYKVLTWFEAGDRYTFTLESVVQHDLRAKGLDLRKKG